MIDLLRRGEGVVKVIEHGRTRLETQSTRAKADAIAPATARRLQCGASRRTTPCSGGTCRRTRASSRTCRTPIGSRRARLRTSRACRICRLSPVCESRVRRRERGRAGTVERWNGHLHAVEQASRRWRGGHDPAVAETRRENLIHAQIVLLPALPLRQLWPLRVGPEGRTAWERRCLQSYASPMPPFDGQPD